MVPVGARTGAQRKHRFQIGEGHRVEPFGLIEHHRKKHVAETPHRFTEPAVALFAVGVPFGEEDVEHDRTRLVRLQGAHQLGVDLARPGPAPGTRLHPRKARIVDIDENDLRIGCEPRRRPALEGIEQPVLERRKQVQPAELENPQ